ncbi:hypothetical protein [Cryobacterium sp. Y57]|nr:hypothetical protein [Cryobacterium sp. Y57]
MTPRLIPVSETIPQVIFSDAPLVLNAAGAALGIDWERIVKESLK